MKRAVQVLKVMRNDGAVTRTWSVHRVSVSSESRSSQEQERWEGIWSFHRKWGHMCNKEETPRNPKKTGCSLKVEAHHRIHETHRAKVERNCRRTRKDYKKLGSSFLQSILHFPWPLLLFFLHTKFKLYTEKLILYSFSVENSLLEEMLNRDIYIKKKARRLEEYFVYELTSRREPLVILYQASVSRQMNIF